MDGGNSVVGMDLNEQGLHSMTGEFGARFIALPSDLAGFINGAMLDINDGGRCD